MGAWRHLGKAIVVASTLLVGGCGPGTPAASVDAQALVNDLTGSGQPGNIIRAAIDQGFLNVTVTDGTTTASAETIVCQWVASVIERHRASNAFAIYRPDGTVLATSGDC